METQKYLSHKDLLILALISAVVTANAYYLHPIISDLAKAFEVSEAQSGLAPASNQIALALGIFLLLPLGDRLSNRTLVLLFVSCQILALILMAVATDFTTFVVGSSILGFFTIAPYLLPAYVSKRVAPAQLGYATAMLTTGVIAGILVARVGAGVVGEYLGWRAVYFSAIPIMLGVALIIPFTMEGKREVSDDAPKQSYFALLWSIFPLVSKHPAILIYGTIQALGFGSFLAVWMGLGLYLPSEEMGYGVDVVGYLAGLTLLNLFTTPICGRWADKVGHVRARVSFSLIQFTGILALYFLGHSLWMMLVPLLVMNVAGPLVDITGRMTFLSKAPEIRTRLTTVYIVMMFVGGGAASGIATYIYDIAGWAGTSLFAVCMSATVLVIALLILLFDIRNKDTQSVP